VVECVPTDLARRITESVKIPTIGIGAGPHCDGQILVTPDLLGLFTDLKPRFVKQYADLGQEVTRAVEQYCREVREGNFPDAQHSFR
jgi:3-methyl-2-oxobutanoate hydroxymethyltransferase